MDKLNILTQKLDSKYDVFKAKGGYMNNRQKSIQKYIIEKQPLKISDISQEFNKINTHTIKKDLQYMKKERLIKSIGSGKGMVYIEINTNEK